MRRTIIVCLGILMLMGLAAGGYWFLQGRNIQETIPESGIFVMADETTEAAA